MSHAGVHAPGSWSVAVGLAVLLLGGYAAAAAVLGARTRRSWPGVRALAFAAGVVALAVGLSPLVAALAPSGARAHMAQHVLLGMVAPLGLVLGMPLTLVLSVLPVGARRRGTAVLRSRPARVLGHPVTAATLHVGGLYALYLTPLFAWTLAHPGVHAAVLVHFVLAGFLFAWSLAGPERAGRRPGIGWRLGVLVAASAAHGYLAKLLHLRAGELPPGAGHGVAELRDAAQWMYYAGDAAEVALAVVLLAGWYGRAGRHGVPRPAPSAA